MFDNKVVEWGARLGYIVNGVLHLTIAWICVKLVRGFNDEDVDQGGALQLLASTPAGKAVVIAMIAGFVLLTLWQVGQMLSVREKRDKAKLAGKGAAYAALAVTATTWLVGIGRRSADQTKDVTHLLMDRAWGPVLVGVIGLAVVGIGVYHVVKGVRRRFLQDLQEHPGRWAVAAGQVGYVVKGVALAIVGGLFVAAALRHDADGSTGLDGSLRLLLGLPLGTVLVLVVAAGFAAYAVYSAARARYARV